MRVEFLHEVRHRLVGDGVDIEGVHIGGGHELQEPIYFGLLDGPRAVVEDDTLRVHFLG